MAPTADEFLNDLAKKELVSPEILASLRRQVAGSSKPVAAQKIAKLLVEKGHLTAVQSQRMLGGPVPPASGTKLSAATPAAPKPQPKPVAKPQPAAKAPAPLDDFGLAPLGDLEPLPDLDSLALAPEPAPQPAASAIKKQPAAPAKSAIAKATPPAPAKPAAAPAKPAAPAPAVADLAPLDDLTPLDSLGSEDLLGSPLAGGDPFAQPTASGDLLSAAPAATTLAAPLQPAAGGESKTGLIVGGILGGVLLIVAIAAGIFLFLPRGHDNLAFTTAEQDYQNKQYAAAAEKFKALLSADPSHPQAAVARVHGAMAKLLAANPAAKNWPVLLPIVKQALGEVAGEPGLSELHPQLAPILTDMATGLAASAREAKPTENAALVAHAREALALASDGRFVPGALQQWQRLADASETLALLGRDQDRAAAISAAKAAFAGGKLEAILAERAKLLADYPDLADHADLAELGRQLAQSAAGDVQPAPYSAPAETTEPKSPIVASLALAARQPAAGEGAAGEPVFMLAGGSAWGLDRITGKLLWRRSLGSNSGPAPLALEGGDALLVDAAHHEVLRVDGRTGALHWRHLLGGPVDGSPLVVGAQIVVATRAGKVLALDAQTGAGKLATPLPLGVRVAPVADPDGKRLYVLAESLLLFVLDAADLKCLDCTYLGHESGSVQVPPVAVPGKLLVDENRGLSQAVLHAIPLDAAGLVAGEAQKVDLPGHVLTPPVVLGDRVVVLTDGGRTLTFALSADSASPLRKLDETELAPTTSLARYGLVQAGKLWIADVGIKKYDVQPATGKLVPQWAGFASSVIDRLPQAAGDMVVLVRREPRQRGFVVSAIKEQAATPAWETRLAAPLAGEIVVDAAGKSANLASSWGAIAPVELAGWQGAAVSELIPSATGGNSLAGISGGVILPGGRTVWTLAGESSELLVLDAGAARPRTVAIPSPLAGAPLAWSGGLVAACSSGVLCWLGQEAGAVPISVFQLKMQAGSRLSNCSLAAAGENGTSLVLSDGRGALHHLELKTTPLPHLVELAVARLDAPPISPVTAGKLALIVARGGDLQAFSLPDLKPAGSLPLAARGVTWGPRHVGDQILLATDRDELVCCDADGRERWRSPLTHGPLAGCGQEASGNLIVSSRSGVLSRIAADTGKGLGHIDLAQPLAGSPVAVGQHLLVATTDGALLKVSFSAAEGAP